MATGNDLKFVRNRTFFTVHPLLYLSLKEDQNRGFAPVKKTSIIAGMGLDKEVALKLIDTRN